MRSCINFDHSQYITIVIVIGIWPTDEELNRNQIKICQKKWKQFVFILFPLSDRIYVYSNISEYMNVRFTYFMNAVRNLVVYVEFCLSCCWVSLNSINFNLLIFWVPWSVFCALFLLASLQFYSFVLSIFIWFLPIPPTHLPIRLLVVLFKQFAELLDEGRKNLIICLKISCWIVYVLRTYCYYIYELLWIVPLFIFFSLFRFLFGAPLRSSNSTENIYCIATGNKVSCSNPIENSGLSTTTATSE